MRVKIHCLLLAGGTGKRAGTQKQFVKISKDFLFEITLKKIQKNKDFDKTVLVLPKKVDRKIEKLCANKYKKVILATGGENRLYSIKQGLEKLLPVSSSEDIILIFDSSRPLTTQKMIRDLVSKALKTKKNILIASRIHDAVAKITDDKKGIIEPKLRSDYLITYTPFAFRQKYLKKAITKSDLSKEIDIAIIVDKKSPGTTSFTEISHHDLKITYPEDLKLLKKISKK